MAKIDREELRALVRQALKDALGPGAGAAPKPAAPAPTAADGAGELARLVRKAVAEGRRAEISVALRTADDADRFARHVAEASADPEVKAAILGAGVRFVPVGPAPAAAAGRPAPAASSAPQARAPGPAYEMTSGVLTEAKLVEIARTHGRITLGAAVVLTPLARDKAREMKIELTRQKP
jgi:hypothetical protein